MAVDLQAMAPLPGVTQIQGDITKVQTELLTPNHSENKMHVIKGQREEDVCTIMRYFDTISAKVLETNNISLGF